MRRGEREKVEKRKCEKCIKESSNIRNEKEISEVEERRRRG